MKNRMIDVIQDVIKDKKKLYLIGGILAVLLVVIVCVIAGGQEEKKHKSSEEKQGKVTVTEKNDKNKTENEVTSPAVEDDKEQNSENTEASAQAVATPTPAPVSYSEAEGSRKVYLTFDDGTSEQTDKILDILAQYGVKATFFVTAKGGEENAARYRRIVAEGHSIGLHSVSHDYKQVYASLDSYIADVEGIRQFVLNTTGVDSHLYRFPGGSSNSVSAIPMEECIRYLNQNGYRYFDWNIDTSDSVNRNQSVEELVSKALGEGVDKYQYHNSVILMHDSATQSHTVAALPAIIEGLQARGIEMLPITENTPGVQHRKAASVQ